MYALQGYFHRKAAEGGTKQNGTDDGTVWIGGLNTKIIDFERKGNVVRFYLGDDECTDYWGDDWNDEPYEHNAGSVYSEFVEATKDIAFPFDSLVLEPCSGARNSIYSKKDMKNRLCPCIIVIPKEVYHKSWHDDFAYWVGCSQAQRFYFEDLMEG